MSLFHRWVTDFTLNFLRVELARTFFCVVFVVVVVFTYNFSMPINFTAQGEKRAL